MSEFPAREQAVFGVDSADRDSGLSLEHVVKEYPPLGPMRARRFFSRLGGLQFDPALADRLADDEDDDFVDEEEEQEVADRGGIGRKVVDHVSFEVQRGSRLALVGPSSAGKTVLLKMISGIVAPSEGRIVARGRVAPALNILAAAIPKDQKLGTALPYIAAVAGLPPGLVRSRLDEISDFMELPQLRTLPTLALDKRRRPEVLLATMLCLDPDIIVTDIPIALGSFAERCVQRLNELQTRGTILIAEARGARGLVPLPDRVLELDRGRIISDRLYDPATEKQRQAAG